MVQLSQEITLPIVSNLRNFSEKRQKGFTLIELSVVIVVIAILAAVAIVSYGAWRKDVSIQQVSSDLTQAAASMENAKAFSKDGYPSALPDTFVASPGITITYMYGNATSFCIQGYNQDYTDITYSYRSGEATPLVEGACTTATLYTNLAHNPRPTDSNYYKSSSGSAATVTFGSAGNEYARLTRVTTAAVALYIERTTGGTMIAQEGDQYTIRYDIYSPINTTVTSQIGYGSSTSANVLGGASSQTVNITSGTQTVRYTFTVPSGYDGQPLFPKILWAAGQGANGNYFNVSKLMVVEGEYPDGAEYGDGNVGNGWSWAGTPNNSQSTGPAFYQDD